MLKIGQSKNSSRFKRIFAEVTCRADVIPSKSLARFKNRFGWVCDQSDSSKALSDETKKFHRDRYRDFFSRPKFSRPRPRLFSRPNIFETDTETFFETKCFRDWYRDFCKSWKVKWRHKLKHLQNQETIATHWLFLKDQWELSAFTNFMTIRRSNPTHPHPSEAIAKVKQ